MHRYQTPHLTPAKLTTIRQRWLKEMTKRRADVAALTVTERAVLERITDPWDWPQITVYGGPDANVYPPHEAYKLASFYHIPSWYMCPWLITEDGWQAYLMAFSSLPDLVELCTPLCKTSQLYTDPVNLAPARMHRR